MNRKARAIFLKFCREEGWSNDLLITLENKAKELGRDSYRFQWITPLDSKPTDFWWDEVQSMWVGFEKAYSLLGGED